VKYVLVEDYVPPEEREEEISGRRSRKKPKVRGEYRPGPACRPDPRPKPPRPGPAGPLAPLPKGAPRRPRPPRAQWMREMEDDRGLQSAIIEESKRKAGSGTRRTGQEEWAEGSPGASGRDAADADEDEYERYQDVSGGLPAGAYGAAHAYPGVHAPALYRGDSVGAGLEYAGVELPVGYGDMHGAAGHYALHEVARRQEALLQAHRMGQSLQEEALGGAGRGAGPGPGAGAGAPGAEAPPAGPADGAGRGWGPSARESLKRKLETSNSYQDLVRSFAPEDIDMLKEMMQSAEGQSEIPLRLREGIRDELRAGGGGGGAGGGGGS